MASSIDPLKPESGSATTASVRSNFSVAASEITALQNADTTAAADLASTANGKGASLVGIEDSGGRYTLTTVEGALSEAATTADLASTSSGKGAALVGIQDAGGRYTLTTVEGALSEAATTAALAASSGSSLVGFIQSGTGATARTLQAKSREIVSVTDFGAVGDGVTSDTAAVQAALTAAVGQTLYVPDGTFLVGALTGVSDVRIVGNGVGSVIKAAAADIDILTFTGKSNIRIENVKFLHVASTSNGNGVVFSNSNNAIVRGCEFEGMSGNGVLGTAGAQRIWVDENYFHTFTGSIQDSSDIAFYNNCSKSMATKNVCLGGNWHGVRFQLDSTDNIADGNYIGAHTAYGVVAGYETTPKEVRNKVTNNTIVDISGDALIVGVKIAGAGIYGVASGGLVITGNAVKNTNNNTTTETLTPAGIGISEPFSPCLVANNFVSECDWYGIAVFTSSQEVSVIGNVVTECVKIGIYSKNSNYINISNNTILNVAAANVRGILAYGQSGAMQQVNITGNKCRGHATNGMSRGIEALNIDEFTISGNQISDTQGAGIAVDASQYGVVSGNSCVATASYPCLVNASDDIQVSGNTFRTTFTYSLGLTGTLTNILCKDNSLSPVVVNNSGGTGVVIEAESTAAPSSGTWGARDRINNNASAAAGAILGWKCISAGTPGTWRPIGVVPGVSADRGNAAQTLTAGTDEETQRWATELTADRAVTLSTTGVWNGAKFRVVRPATGAFNLNVGTGPLKALAAGQWCDVEYNGSAWMLTAYGAL